MRRNMVALIAAASIVAGCGPQAKVTTGAQLQPGAVPTVAPSTTQPVAAVAKPPDDDPVAAVRRDKSLEGALPDGKEVRRRTRIQEARLLKDCLAARGVSFDGVLQSNVDEGNGTTPFGSRFETRLTPRKTDFCNVRIFRAGRYDQLIRSFSPLSKVTTRRIRDAAPSVGDQLASLGVEATRQLYSELVTTFQNRQTESIESDPGVPAVTQSGKPA